MAKNGFKAMDSDMHVMEPCDLWQRYIDSKFADRAPIGLSRHKRDLGIQVEGKIMPRPAETPNPALGPNHVNGRRWSDPYYDPLWSECQKLGVPVGFHEAGRVFLPQPALSQFIPSFTMFNTLSFPMASMLACADMIYGGVMERFPKLKVAFLEGNCSWIPWLLWRMG